MCQWLLHIHMFAHMHGRRRYNGMCMIGGSYNYCINLVTHFCRLVLGLGLLFYLNWQLALIVVAALPVYATAFYLMRPRVRETNIAYRRVNSGMYALAAERISGIQVAKVFGHERGEVLEMVKALREPTRAEPGCVDCNVYQDLHDENLIVLEEVWESRADLDRHIRSHRYRHVLALMEMASTPPEIRFDTISHRAGIEVVRAVRQR